LSPYDLFRAAQGVSLYGKKIYWNSVNLGRLQYFSVLEYGDEKTPYSLSKCSIVLLSQLTDKYL